MSRTQLICRSCGAKLTALLDPITTVSKAAALCDFECDERGAPVPRGHVLFVEGDVFAMRQADVQGWKPEGLPQAWMHLEDVAPFVGDSADTRRMSGCCGPSGIDGPNRVCACGVDVGTESSDCWTWHMFVPLAENTYWKEHD